MNKSVFLKTGKIITNVVTYCFIAFSVVLLFFTLLMKNTDGDTVTLFNRQIRIVTSDSMEACEQTDVSKYDIKSIPLRSLVFIQTVPDNELEAKTWFAKLKVGDVLTFRFIYNGQVTITHRIVKIEEKADGGRMLYLEGDNKTAGGNLMQQTLDTSKQFDPTNYNYTIGKVTGRSVVLGTLLFLISQPVGMFFIILIPCLIIIIAKIIKIISVFHEEKQQKQLSEKQKQDAEIALLKEQLAMLQTSSAQNDGNAPTAPTQDPQPLKESSTNE